MLNFISRHALKNGGGRKSFIRLIAILAFGMTALMFWLAADTDRGLPSESELVSADGKLARVSPTSASIRFYLDGHKRGFTYAAKMGGNASVRKALKQTGADVSLKFHPRHFRGPIYSNERYFDVFHLSVNGKLVRSYDQIRRSWIADNQVGLWAGSAFAVLGLYLWAAAGKLHPDTER